MILIGQYDSPFVRRVGIALTLYDLPFEHRPWSVFADAEKIRAINPLVRVPTLVLASGTALTDSHMMLDHIDSLVAEDRRMFPTAEPQRHKALLTTTLATGLGEKAVSLFYEQKLHKEVSDVWANRCRMQIASVAAALEAQCAALQTPYWFGTRIGHADIAVASVLRFIGEAHPGLLPASAIPALSSHATRMEALPAFQTIQQAFIPPA